MSLSGRHDTPGQPNDPIESATIPTPPDIGDTRQASVSTENDDDREYDEVQLLQEGPFLIADYLAHNSSKSAAVFRRYDKLAIHRLISLSRELRGFETQHDQSVDDGIDPEVMDGGYYSNVFGPKVLEYYSLLGAYSNVLHLEPPASRTVEALDRFISSPELHSKKPWLGHQLKYRTETTDDRIPFSDLVSLYTPAENDYLSRFVDKFFYGFFLTPESSRDAKYVNEQKMQRFVTFVGTVISIGFLVAAMWVLWRLEDHMIPKLGAVTGFVVAFAGWLGFLTTAQRKDVIAATAAYAAVLVVFVSQQSPVSVVTQGTGTVVTQSR